MCRQRDKQKLRHERLEDRNLTKNTEEPLNVF